MKTKMSRLGEVVNEVFELKDEKARIEMQIKMKEDEVKTELIESRMTEYLNVNWTRLRRNGA